MNSALAEFLRITQDPGTVQYWYSVRRARVSRAWPRGGNLRRSPKGEDPPKRRGVLIMILILVL